MTVSLILCDIDCDEENVEAHKSIELGSYEYINCYLSTISKFLEEGKWGKRFPILIESLDAKAKIDPDTAEELLMELNLIREELKKFPPCRIDCENIETDDKSWIFEAPFENSAETIYDYFLNNEEDNLTETFYSFAQEAVEDNLSIMYIFN